MPIHWRTTKRLSSPNLIGIVRLANREASLRRTDEIYWAEVVFQGKSMDEFRARERGCLTFRLLQYLDEPGNAMLLQNPAVGDAVALIDCQTFVPEFIPVLKALETQRQMPVPFQNGALLNLCDEASFSQEHTAAYDNESDDDTEEFDTLGSGGLVTNALIRKVIQLSLLDPIVDIRRDEGLRSRLERSLLGLVNSATLDAGQLKSFTEALMYPVHCTQGPPGTGKSYLGVIVVRALLIIRDLWKLKNADIGDPPILVLSYKNHAIDEFLLDLVRSEPTLGHTPVTKQYFSRYYRRGFQNNGFKRLVRIGGSCNEPELEQYRERNVAFSDPRVRAVSERIEVCQELREQWHKFRDCFGPIFEGQHTVANGTASLSAEDWKVVQGAVPDASTAVATLMKLEASITPETEDKPPVSPDTEEKEEDSSEDVDSDDAESSEVSLATVTIVLKKKPTLTNEDIVKLYEGIKHYDSSIHPQEVLYQWISGFCPLPACTFKAEPCSTVCADGSRYCLDHSCKFSTDGEMLCPNEVIRKRLYCEQHLCAAEKCKKSKMDETQSFCEDHACFVCLGKGEVAGVAVDESPRNSCERHPLCWGMNGMCPDVAEPNSSYCKAHAEQLHCKWRSRSGVCCHEIATTGQYCGKHHAVVANDEQARSLQSGTGKCMAQTKKGKACKGQPLSGTSYCRDHVGRRNEPPTQHPRAKPETSAAQTTKKEIAGTQEDTPLVKILDTLPVYHSEAGQCDVKEEKADESKTEEENLFDSDSDMEEFVDAEQYANEDEVEESEYLQHLREVHEVDDEDSDDAVDAMDEEIEDEEKSPWTVSDQALTPPHEWHWEMALDERWSALFSVLNLWGDINTNLQLVFTKTIGELKMELQREILRANSRVYEGKAVIGGTITGCVSRLEAIRTTNPFAILVEEASEVMEPLLFSCFSSSTRKLEMIGDHMQLQPSVMGRIDFERVNKINISMFERLISAPPGNEVPSSVLSIQRRMRKNICDLTRNFYNEITTIEDHAVCGMKVIGGAKRTKGAVPLLDACEGAGREVPGVSPHIFFWTHTGAQQRASVGLSRVNNQEATMACKLVKYLVECGVPPKSIAVLTPYKGQLMLMRKMVMNSYNLRTMTKGRDAKPVPACLMSTVDRFQGDEADVVIISLVIDGKSRTPFVKLQNRMIVLLSRARLGMYVVGNVDYFGETSHWQKTLSLLKNEAESDNTAESECFTYDGPRIGPALPICCPGHRTSVSLAKGEKDLKLGFCSVVCSVELSCSHECGLMCHWPHVDKHNKKCQVEVESPCTRHPRLLKCCAVTATSFTKVMSIDEALKKYQCDTRVDVSLPCGHNKKMQCHAHSEIEAQRASWPECNKEAIAPYVYPVCKHFLKCTCCEFDRYSKGYAPACKERVEFNPPCQHTVSLSCHARQDYVNQVRRFVCKEQVKVSLPRCGHETTVSCPIAESLKEWSGDSCPTVGVVKEGETYGPKDYFCKQPVQFQRRCGHHEMVRCERGFELVRNPSRCSEAVVISNPECGHESSTTCFEKDRLRDKVASSFFCLGVDEVDPLEVVKEGYSSNFYNFGLNIQCPHQVLYVRSCGHRTRMKCSEARHTTAVCDEMVQDQLPICGHRVRLPCHLTKHLTAWQPWQELTPSVQFLRDESVVVDTLPLPGARPAVLRSILNDCVASVRFRRTSSCGHDIEMKCCDAFQVLQGKQTPIPCSVRVLKELSCGHQVTIKCSEGVDSVQCKENVDKSCWNVAVCGSKVTVPCRVSADTVECTKETEWLCSEGHAFTLRLCSRGVPSDCPSCSAACLDEAIKDTQRIMSDKTLSLWSPEEARVLPERNGVTHITMSIPSKRDYLTRKCKLLTRFKEGLEDASVWSNGLFSPVELPVFVVLSRKLQAVHIDKFEMKDFGSLQTLNGIQVYEVTQENFSRVVGGGKATVIFGQLYTVKHLSNPVDLPKAKGKKGVHGT